MLDLSLVDRDLTEQTPDELSTTDERLAKVMTFAASDRFPEAAEQAQALFEQNIFDLRVLGSFLFGVYLERGMEILPEILGSLVRILSSSFSVWGPQNKKQLHADNMLKWLIATMLRDFRLHETQQDDVWKQWNSGSEFTIAERHALKLVPELQERMVNQLGNAKAIPYLLQLESMLQKMELSAQSARPRIGRGRDDILSVKLGGVEPPPDSGSGDSSTASASGDDSSSNESTSTDDSGSSSSSESSGSDSDSNSDSGSSSASSPSTSSSPSSTSSPSSSSNKGDEDGSSSSSSSSGSSSPSQTSSSTSSPSRTSSSTSDEESRAEEEKRREEEERKAREEEEKAERQRQVAEVQSEETPAEAEQPAGKGPRTISVPENEPFRQLRRKLAAFQKLVAAEDHQRAAIVAADLLHTLDHFDPRLFLPSMFRKFFRVLSLVGNELTPHMGEKTDLSSKALLQLYQIDLDYFVKSAKKN